MTRWTVAAPTALDFNDVTQLNVRLIGGTVAVLASDDQPGLAVTELTGRPLQVSHEDGALTVSYESLTWEGLLGLLKPRKDNATVTITVPAECPIQLGVLSASAVVTGLHAGAAVKSMSGDITLDGVTGVISAETMSGEVAACDLDGEIHFKSMSGGLTLAGGSVDTLTVDTMSGQVTADVALENPGNGRGRGSVHINTMSGEVTLRLPADSAAQVHLHSTSGPVRTEFETLRTIKAPASHTVSGNVGAGTGHVSVTTMSGAVTLLRGAAVGMESKTL
ncbi:MAG TPA: DUF4097 family beta strand repeat-containing protein [Trebonia sp.]|jgi:hypothetical protein|nr:DUF4097 family beta strand repeat-containing protein [Trebonia sp.]